MRGACSPPPILFFFSPPFSVSFSVSFCLCLSCKTSSTSWLGLDLRMLVSEAWAGTGQPVGDRALGHHHGGMTTGNLAGGSIHCGGGNLGLALVEKMMSCSAQSLRENFWTWLNLILYNTYFLLILDSEFKILSILFFLPRDTNKKIKENFRSAWLWCQANLGPKFLQYLWAMGFQASKSLKLFEPQFPHS